MWHSPVTDRALSDITNRTVKGFLNVADWIRINDNARAVNGLMLTLRGIAVTFTELPEPTITSFPTAADINAFVNNIEQVRALACFSTDDVPVLGTNYTEGSGGKAPNYVDVNNWELDCKLLRLFLCSSADWTTSCGVAGTGQSKFYQVRWRVHAWVANAVSPVRRARAGVGVCGAGLQRNNNYRRYA